MAPLLKLRADPITREVIRAHTESIAEQMILTIMKASYSFNLKEARDMSAIIFDAQGRMIAESYSMPIHLGSLGRTIKAILKHYFPPSSLSPGDIIITNDPYLYDSLGPHHTNDITVFCPAFLNGELVGFAEVLCHYGDVGGLVYPVMANDIYAEGIRVPPIKLYEEGKPNEEVIKILVNNSRQPKIMKGDLSTQAATSRMAAGRLAELIQKYGLETISACVEDLADISESRYREEIKKIPKGTYTYEDVTDDDGAQGGPYTIRVRIDVLEDSLKIDFTGTSRQANVSINAPFSATISSTHAALRLMLDPYAPSNDGCFRPYEIYAPPGTLVNPVPPAATSSRMVSTHRIHEVVVGAMAKADPKRAIAASYGCSINVGVRAQRRDTGEWFVCLQGNPGGLGARPNKDGIDVICAPLQNWNEWSIEPFEIEFPFLFLKHEFRPDSEGAGKYRGGLGQIRAFRILADNITVNTQSDRFVRGPPGLEGGERGATSMWIINMGTEKEIRLKSKVTNYPITSEEVFYTITAGGGGYGNPLERDPELVKEDVLNGKISPKRARDVYGLEPRFLAEIGEARW